MGLEGYMLRAQRRDLSPFFSKQFVCWNARRLPCERPDHTVKRHLRSNLRLAHRQSPAIQVLNVNLCRSLHTQLCDLKTHALSDSESKLRTYATNTRSKPEKLLGKQQTNL